MAYAEVVVTLPVPGTFHYTVPEYLDGALETGHRLLVPFGNRKVTAFVVGLSETIEPDIAARAKPIASRLDAEPMLPLDILRLATFTADYYLATVGEVLALALPPGLAAGSILRLVATAEGRRVLEDPFGGPDLSPTERKLLTDAAKGKGVKGNRVRSKAADLLESRGWVHRKESLDAKETGGELEIIERVMGPKEAWPLITRSATRRELYQMLEEGPQPAEELETRFGRTSFRTALKRMLGDGVVSTRRIARSTPEAQTLLQDTVTLNEPLPELTEEQKAAVNKIGTEIDSADSKGFLLHGVTGSGKTEVYLRVIQDALTTGKGAIVLVPEIALTPQLEARFKARFGDEVAVLHSGLADGERRRRWWRLRHGEARIALGPRSALWAPVKNLGVVVVDEEHDPSFKQGSDVRYHGRDLALTRAKQTGAIAILGSATPALETQHLARQGRLHEVRLHKRVANRPLPAIQVVDLVEERRQRKGEVHIVSRPLGDRLRDVVSDKKQAIIFLNRRGFNTIVHCEDCGAARTCPSCSVTLTHHRRERKLSCHYCGFEVSFESACPTCKSTAMKPAGAGTERVVAAVQEEVPDAKILRLDRDTTQRVGSLDETLRAFRNREADILVGTQMVTKGHDFPGVTLVGVILADASLAFPDFRAAERTFQLLTQVAGRAGRAEDPGHVVIQTLQPEHYAITTAVQHDTDRFFELEAEGRAENNYPPYNRIGLVRTESKQKDAALDAIERASEAAAQAIADMGPDYRLLGPAPATLERLRERWRFVLMIFAPSPAKLVSVMRRIKAALADHPRYVDVLLDVDPLDLL